MPYYEVTIDRDAWAHEECVLEAASPAEAAKKAYDAARLGHDHVVFVAAGMSQFDHVEEVDVEKDVMEITAEEYAVMHQAHRNARLPLADPEAKLRAIEARIMGHFDQSDLLRFGPLNESPLADILAIVRLFRD